MEDIVNQLITVAEGLLALGLSWFIWFISGVANNWFSPKKWSWKRTAEDIIKTILVVIAALSWVVLMNIIKSFTAKADMDFSTLLNNISVTGLIGIILGATCVNAYKAYRNIANFIVKDHSTLEMIEEIVGTPEDLTSEQFADLAEPGKQIINGVYQYFTQSKESVEAHEEWEEKGGRGAAYNVPITSYDAFRSTVLGKGYNIDGAYGAQCWDGAGLLWQQVGMWLQTGNGCAYGCWTLKKDANLGSQFTAITNEYHIRRGDVVVFRAGEYGHIAFADEDYYGGGFLKILGQNQGGIPYAGGGANFNVVNMSMATFLGAFRFKGWAKAEAPKEEPASTPAPKPAEVTFEKGDKVYVEKYVDVNGNKLRADLQATPFLVYQSRKSDKTAVLKSDDGDIYARIAWANLKKV